jgi:hypothetical protein
MIPDEQVEYTDTMILDEQAEYTHTMMLDQQVEYTDTMIFHLLEYTVEDTDTVPVSEYSTCSSSSRNRSTSPSLSALALARPGPCHGWILRDRLVKRDQPRASSLSPLLVSAAQRGGREDRPGT